MATEIYAVNNNNLNALIQKLKEDLTAFPEGMDSLANALESTTKHLPAYLRIVKTHIEQLAKVLGTENHFNRKIETTNLAEPVKQLINLFKVLEEQDLTVLEDLAKAAKNWQVEATTAFEQELLSKTSSKLDEKLA